MTWCGGAGPIVVFDYQAWIARYRELSLVSEPAAQGYFDEACIYWNNIGGSPVSRPQTQSLLLNMLTAHIAAIYSQAQGDPLPGAAKDANVPPGAIASASEGSVSASFKNEYPPGTSQWYQQTKYGSSFWAATTVYRRFRYMPPTQGPNAYGAGPFAGGGFRGRGW